MSTKVNDHQVQYFRIKNWEKYQQFKPKKAYSTQDYCVIATSFLDDPKTCDLSMLARLSWVCLILLAGRSQNRLRWDPGWCQVGARLKKPVPLALFESLGLIERIGKEGKEGKEGEAGENTKTAAPALLKNKNFTQEIKPELWQQWLKQFHDREWIEMELHKAQLWLNESCEKMPKSMSVFFTRWLAKSWNDKKQAAAPIETEEEIKSFFRSKGHDV